jgi:hypothetical protein
MRYSKAVALLLTLSMLLATSLPVFAWSGGSDDIIRIIDDEAHPWQDDSNHNPDPDFSLTPTVPVGPIVISIEIRLPSFFTKMLFGPEKRMSRFEVRPQVQKETVQSRVGERTCSWRSEVR